MRGKSVAASQYQDFRTSKEAKVMTGSSDFTAVGS